MRCIIIEDERPAQEVLKEFIGQCPALELKGVYANAMEAQSMLNSGKVDLLFLDINLPLISGIELLKSIKNPPQVIITTAYPEYAIEGFNLDVTDYLLKPFSFSRFLKATNKALKQFQNETVETITKPAKEKEYSIILNIDKVLHKLSPHDVLYLSSDRDYVEFHTTQRKYVMVGALRKWEIELPKTSFVRIHKSHIVNIRSVDQVIGNQVKVRGQILPIGRKYKPEFLKAFGKPS
ncbi:MAG: response regulator transcription factor [Roseivirga sp.]|uniref:LytR/AlgR family response regulator transcription factor n=1 Tax=Roseivirga sp. TaxID=1964215 RepID=UPI001AFFECF6|nr:LytTR family DNA-binding domain-containing protein [Roseivirga sp.]MBO6659941.1 response regulator transcription factor [Roseivirga sp.]MBO6762111.1 response regulator transcription factor [Roseivirga sp.]MBO6907322.1 response regulator transcription factor [Roseivirga sp.]